MKKQITFLIIGLLVITSLKGQIKIGDNPQNLDPSSVLELESNSRVLVITRMTTTQMENTTPLRGAMVYNTDIECVHFYTGTEWMNLCDRPEEQTFTADAVVNFSPTMVITQTGSNFNFEVGEIRGENIVDTSINGDNEIQQQTITNRLLAEKAVSFDKLADGTAAGEILRWEGVGTGWVLVNESDLGITEEDGVIGNEVTGPADGTLELSGLGDSTNPFLLDVSANGITENELANNAVTTDIILNGAVTNDKLDKANVSLTGFAAPTADLSIGTNKLTNVVDPTDPQDAATMAYVDSEVAGINTLADGNIYVGDAANSAQEVTIGGDALMANDGTLSIQADVIGDTEIDKANVSLTGFAAPTADLSIGTNKLTNVVDPTDPQDAATMAYVDSEVAGINTLADGNIYVGDAANSAQEVTIGGDALMANDGTLSIQADVIGDTEIDKANVSLTGFAAPTADLSIGTNKLTNVVDPTDPQDAATMAYVDSEVAGINTLADGNIYVGDAANSAQEVTIGGDALMANDGTLSIQADVIGDTEIDKANVSLTGFAAPTADLSIGTNKLTNVVDPTDPQDAATMAYVDSEVAGINTLADGNIYVGDAANSAQEVTIGGDALMANDGTLSIQADVIGDTEIDKANVSLTGFAAPTADLSIGTNKLTNVVDPTDPQDAATMAYVDSEVAGINTLADGNIYVGDAANSAQEVTIGGDALMANDGTLSIQADVIGDTEIDKANVSLTGFAAPTADLSIGTNKLTNVVDPTDPQDAATMAYVDSEVAGINTLADGNIYVGDAANSAQEVTIGGDALMANDGTLSIQADVIGDTEIDKANVSLTGFAAPTADLSIGTNKLTNVVDPTDPQDAATMAYVDSTVKPIRSEPNDYTAISGDHTIILTTGGSFTTGVTLPALTTGKILIIRNNSGGAVNIVGASVLSVNSGDSLWVQYDGTTWQQIN